MDYVKYAFLGLGIFIIVGVIVKICVTFNPIPGLRKLFYSWRPRQHHSYFENQMSDDIMLQQRTGPRVHDHSNTVFIPGRGVFFSDMCPLNSI